MQNRSMFPYRRHGPKKRTKGGGPMRKPRGPHKGLPNSARDLLPLLQPATKALAQMLAGRTQVSGQLEQARAMLNQAERLIADRVHNRLNPAEREEFFEQLARLRLTLADAADEAEARAVEEQRPRAPQPPPIAQERLKEMALALATREGARRRPGAGGDDQTGPAAPAPELPEASVSGDQPPRADRAADPAAALPEAAAPGGPAGEPAAAGAEAPPEATSGPRRLLAINKPGRLELPKDAAVSVARTLSIPRDRGAGPRRMPSAPSAATLPVAPAQDDRTGPPAGAHDAEGGNGAAEDAESREKIKATRRSRKTQQGLPEGWIIDEEGFVVPGPS
jgi:hypothetical protein